MNNLTTFYIVRHGQTEWNTKGLVQGHSDSPLTEKGINDIKDIAKELKNIDFDLAFSSDLLRAKRTAEILAAEHDLTVETSKLLRERKFGHLEGKSKEIFKEWEEKNKHLTNAEKFAHKDTDDIESDEEISTRLIQFIREIAIANPGKNVLTVSHGGIIKALLMKLDYGNYDTLGSMKNGAFIEIDSDGTEILLKQATGVEFKNQNAK